MTAQSSSTGRVAPIGTQEQSDLNVLYESEVLGFTLFATAAQLTASPERRRKWEALRDLEAQTMARFTSYLRTTGRTAHAARSTRIRGRLLGAALAASPWQLSMKELQQGTGPFLQAFKRLEQNAAPDEKTFFAYVVAHEEAIAEFARRERSGQTESSLEPVSRLLAGS